MEDKLSFVSTNVFGVYSVERLHLISMDFMSYVYDSSGEIIGIKVDCDLGHGYEFDNGHKEEEIRLYEEFSFQHDFTNTSDGTWDDDFTIIDVFIIKEEDVSFAKFMYDNKYEYVKENRKGFYKMIKDKTSVDEVRNL